MVRMPLEFYFDSFVGVPNVLHQATIELDNDQIKALPTTVVEVVAAPGANKVIILLAATAKLNKAAVTAYAAATDSSWVFTLNTFQTALFPCESLLETTGLITYAVLFTPTAPAIGGGDFDGYVTGTATAEENTALTFGDLEMGVADYTGGNAANTLLVTVQYTILNTLTGLFE